MIASRKRLVNFIVENREDILHRWINLTIVKERLSKNRIDPQFFARHFGDRVINGFIEVCKNEKSEGECPAISIMFLFFKNKEIPFKDIFQVCVNLKNTFFNLFLDNPSLISLEAINHLIYILDKNFEGVINDYLYFISKEDNSPIHYSHDGEITLDTNDKIDNNIYKVNSEKEVFSEYVLDEHLIELKELESEIDSLSAIISFGNIDLNSLSRLSNDLLKYSTVLFTYPLFKEISNATQKLGDKFKEEDIISLFSENSNMIALLLESFVNDLINWRKDLFERGIADPYYYDKSILSNVEQIIALMDVNNATSEFDEIEFF